MNKTTILAITLLFVTLTGFGVYNLTKSTHTPKFHHRLNKIAQEVNSMQTSWKAGENERFVNNDIENIKRSLGALETPQHLLQGVEVADEVADVIPDSFDARQQWGAKCPSLNEVRDQSNCGSCWAFGAAESLSDRHCIHTGEDIRLSTENLVDCCASCGNGCNGGYPIAAMQYYVKTGLVTGDLFGDKQTCQPYSFAPCAHHVTSDVYPPCTGELPTPKCKKTCQNGLDYAKDIRKGVSAYAVKANEAAIQTEIMKYGPVEIAITVYEDFLTYKSGVYHHTTGKALGGHAVKMVGWGIENGTKYWIVVNSWNESWGDNGTIKMRRGTNECGIESQVVAGMPVAKSSVF